MDDLEKISTELAIKLNTDENIGRWEVVSVEVNSIGGDILGCMHANVTFEIMRTGAVYDDNRI